MFDLQKSIDKHFPYASAFPGQREAIEQIAKAFLDGEKYVFAQVPTGVGKSAIAYTVHKIMREANPGYRSTITTVTKALQDQYQNEFNEIYDLRGKINYPCLHNVGPYGSAGCHELLHQKICSQTVCPYVMQRKQWCEDEALRITNSSFMIEACPSLVMLPENKSDLLVIDECHTLDTHLVDHSTLDLQTDKLKAVNKVMGNIFVEPFYRFINGFKNRKPGCVVDVSQEDGMAEAANKLHQSLETEIENLHTKVRNRPGNSAGYLAAIEEMQGISDKLNMFANNGGEWIVQESTPGRKIILKPVYARQVAEHAIFRKGNQFLLMSATICGYEEFARALGIKRYKVVEIPNPIPAKDRPVYACSLMKVAGNFDSYQLTKYIDKIIGREKGNGIIHTVSYKLAKEILEDSKYSSKMIIHQDLEETMAHMSRNDGSIVLSPSMEQGYDFKGDLARWQIIAKYPYDYLGDPWIKLNVDRSQKWYARRSILRVVQASGRAVRGVGDWANTYIIDSEFDRAIKYNSELFPDWFKESIIPRSEIPFLRR